MTAMGGEIGVPEIVDVKIWWYQRKREDIETVQSGYEANTGKQCAKTVQHYCRCTQINATHKTWRSHKEWNNVSICTTN